MRKRIVCAAAGALMMLGGKCGKPPKPKPPRVEAADAAEQAWFTADVDRRLDDSPVVVLDLEVEDARGEPSPARARFRRTGTSTLAEVTLGGETFVFRVAQAGEMVLSSTNEKDQ